MNAVRDSFLVVCIIVVTVLGLLLLSGRFSPAAVKAQATAAPITTSFTYPATDPVPEVIALSPAETAEAQRLANAKTQAEENLVKAQRDWDHFVADRVKKGSPGSAGWRFDKSMRFLVSGSSAASSVGYFGNPCGGSSNVTLTNGAWISGPPWSGPPLTGNTGGGGPYVDKH